MADDLVKRAGKGAAWNLVSQITQQTIQFFVIVVLARLLTPVEFGLFSMAVIFANLINPLGSVGFQFFLIQKKEIDHEYEDTAFWAICVLHLSFFIIAVAAAPFVGAFFNNPKAGQLLALVAIGFLFSPFGAVQWALLNKKLDFRMLAIRDVIVTLFYGFCAITLAQNGFGVWSLAIATLCREFAWALTLWFMYDWRPGFKFNLRKFKEMVGFGANCTGSGVMDYMINNIDNALVGKFLGPASLGFYNIAFNTVSQPQTKLVTHISSVTFPAFSVLKDDKERLRDAYMKTVRMILVLVVPIISILFICAKEFVLTLYGEKWSFAVLPMQILCLYGLLRAITSTTGSVFVSKGRPDMELKILAGKLIVFVIFVCLGLRYGIVGVSVGVLLYSLVTFAPIFYFSNKLLDIKSRDFYLTIFRYLALIAVTIGSVWLAKLFLPQYGAMPLFALLVSEVAIGSFAYCAALVIFYRSDVRNIVNLIAKVIS